MQRRLWQALILALLLFIAAALLIPMFTGVNWVGDLLSDPLPICYLGNDCSVGQEFKCEMRKKEVMFECVR